MLWFISTGDDNAFLAIEASAGVRDRIAGVVARVLGIDADDVQLDAQFWNDMGADSLDMVELVMELEDEFR